MESLTELEYEVESFARTHRDDAGKTIWERLVRSGRESKGVGCDGTLISELSDFAEALLVKLDDDQIQSIWRDTRSGMMACEEPEVIIQREGMIHDIVLDIESMLVESVCEEAKEERGRAKRRAR